MLLLFNQKLKEGEWDGTRLIPLPHLAGLYLVCSYYTYFDTVLFISFILWVCSQKRDVPLLYQGVQCKQKVAKNVLQQKQWCLEHPVVFASALQKRVTADWIMPLTHPPHGRKHTGWLVLLLVLQAIQTCWPHNLIKRVLKIQSKLSFKKKLVMVFQEL